MYISGVNHAEGEGKQEKGKNLKRDIPVTTALTIRDQLEQCSLSFHVPSQPVAQHASPAE